jgi:hypothetical protein
MAEAGSLTFVGEIPQGDLVVTISPLFNIISQPTPQQVGVNATGLPAEIGDEIQFWDPTANGGAGNFTPSLQFFGPGFDWVDGDFNTVDPTPQVGESFFYNSAAGSAVDWTRSFSINN